MSTTGVETSIKRAPSKRYKKKNIIITFVVVTALVLVIVVVVIIVMNRASKGKKNLSGQNVVGLQNDGKVPDSDAKNVPKPKDKKRDLKANNASDPESKENVFTPSDSVVANENASKSNGSPRMNSQEELNNKLIENALDAKNKPLPESSSGKMFNVKDAVAILNKNASTTDTSGIKGTLNEKKDKNEILDEKKGTGQEPEKPPKEDIKDKTSSEKESEKVKPKPEDTELKEITAYLNDETLPHNPVICQKIWKRLNEVLELKDDHGNLIYTLDFVKKRCLQTLPDDVADAFIELQQDLSSTDDWDLNELEEKFADLRAHSGIEQLYPEFAASSVYEAYFDKFIGKVDSLIKARGIANADKATAIIEKLAQKAKTKLDEEIHKDDPSSDLCFHLRKVSLVQDLEDAFENYDSNKFKTQLDELVKHRQTSLTFDESTLGINSESLFYKVEWKALSLVEYKFDNNLKIQDRIKALKDDDLPTKIRKYDQLAQICKALSSWSTKDISSTRDYLIMEYFDQPIIDFIEPVMGTGDLALLLKPLILGLNLDTLPYFLSKTSNGDILKFWAIQRYRTTLKYTMTAKNLSENLAAKFAKTTDVHSVLEAELAMLCTKLGECIASTPPDFKVFKGYLSQIAPLRRSLDSTYSGGDHALEGEKYTQTQDIIQAKLISIVDDVQADHFDEVEILLKMCQEIFYGELKYPNIEVEINTKEDYDEVRRAKIVKTYFTKVNQGEFASNLGPINAQLQACGMEEIDEASLRWLLVKSNMYSELITSDDSPSHSQYTAIKAEIASKLKNIVENLDESRGVYRRNELYLENLMRAWEIIKGSDTLSPTKFTSMYIEALVPKMISNLKDSLLRADDTTVIAQRASKCNMASLYCSTEALIKDDKAKFFASENTCSYDQNTNLFEDAYYKEFKANPLFNTTPDREIVWNLVKDQLDNPSNTRAHNLYVYHYLVPSLDRCEYLLDSSVSFKGVDAKNKIIALLSFSEKSGPVKVLALKMLETQTIAGRKGNGVALYWYVIARPYLDGTEFSALKDEPSVLDKYILKAVNCLISDYKSEKGDFKLKRAYEDNYECLKTLFSGDSHTFPSLS